MEVGLKKRDEDSFVCHNSRVDSTYGSEKCTLTESLKKRFDGWYTRMLRIVLNVDW